ncbi:PaaI family thioesterase [Mycobacterium sp.]|uniref:PaaI family thioesterase n=1 Tax=Mycobacterium sp. TaxID=1785 RepID=UPI0031D13F0C
MSLGDFDCRPLPVRLSGCPGGPTERAEPTDAAGPEVVVLSLDWVRGLTTGNDILHGGIVMALADSSGAVCAFLNLPEGTAGTTTIESKTNFMAAIRAGTVKAHSRPLHVKRRVIVVETEIRGDNGKLAAKTIQSQAVL